MKTLDEKVRDLKFDFWFLFILWLITSCALALTIICMNHKFNSETLPPLKDYDAYGTLPNK
jgi:hypothetical protein